MKFTIFQASRQGARKNNQDRVAYAYSREALLMVVADGMGGHRFGEVAAEVAVVTLVEAFRAQACPRLADAAAFLPRAIFEAHLAINERAAELGLSETPHTTIVAALVQDAVAYWAHVGDSRLYLFGEGRFITRTEDHSAVALMVRNGLITEAEAETHPDRNKVSNCLGGHIAPRIECARPIPLQDADTLLLCTDGVWGMIAADEFSALLRTYPLEEAVRHMMDHAETRGGAHADNLSLVAMTWGEPWVPGRDTVSTLTLAPDAHASRIGRAGDEAPVSDDEIERTIAEIRAVMGKLPGG